MSSSQTDDFNTYRVICANRLRRLERYRKAKSFCSLEDEQNCGDSFPSSAPPFCSPQLIESSSSSSSSSSHFFPLPNSDDSQSDHSSNDENSPFEMIKEKMISLMENDMSLLQQLLALGDQITEMKSGMRRTQSERSLEEKRDIDTESEEEEREDQFDSRFSASLSAVTTLYVDDQPQYFSRKNSVLRIPIPPRASNRFNRRLPRRPSDALRVSTRQSNEDTSSEGSDGPQSPSLTYSASTVSSLGSCGGTLPIKNRSSNSSIDSGIRGDSKPTTPTLSD